MYLKQYLVVWIIGIIHFCLLKGEAEATVSDDDRNDDDEGKKYKRMYIEDFQYGIWTTIVLSTY